jgi:hypothetical protein
MESEFYHTNGPMSWRCPHCSPPKVYHASSYEYVILNFIKEFYDGEVIHGDRTVLRPKELDIYVPEKNFAIEFNGTYWHTSPDPVINEEMKQRHEWKIKTCESLGIRLMYIWDYEWDDHEVQIKIKEEIRKSIQ